MPRDYPRPHLLVTPEALAAELGRPGLHLVDVRWRPDGSASAAWAAGRIPGAIHLDWTRWLALGAGAGGETSGIGRYRLAPAERVRGALAAAGIAPGETIVLYDEAASLFAARAWWALRAWGVGSAVRILDGGFPAWVAEGRPVETGAATPVRADAAGAAGAAQVALPAWPVAHADLDAVVAALDDPAVSIVDVRAPTEFRGHGGNGERLGRIPGAVNVPVGATARPGSSRFRSADELTTLVGRMGLGGGRRAICYDAAGIGAAKVAFVAALLGHDDVSVYDGGWLEWSARPDLPVER